MGLSDGSSDRAFFRSLFHMAYALTAWLKCAILLVDKVQTEHAEFRKFDRQGNLWFFRRRNVGRYHEST